MILKHILFILLYKHTGCGHIQDASSLLFLFLLLLCPFSTYITQAGNTLEQGLYHIMNLHYHKNHRITEWLALEGTPRDHLVQPTH